MQVQPINSANFQSKNTFLLKAKNAATKQDKDYWKSLHYEAKARLSYSKFKNAEDNFMKIEDTGSIVGTIALCTAIMAMSYRKLQSVIYETKSYSLFPNRFAEADDPNALEERNYKIKEQYTDLIK